MFIVLCTSAVNYIVDGHCQSVSVGLQGSLLITVGLNKQEQLSTLNRENKSPLRLTYDIRDTANEHSILFDFSCASVFEKKHLRFDIAYKCRSSS